MFEPKYRYRLEVHEGVNCWLVWLTNPNPHQWNVLGRAFTEEEAIELALEIRAGVMASS